MSKPGGKRVALIILGLFALTALLATPPLIEWWRTRAAEPQLLAQPVYRVLQQHEPAAYARVLEEYKRYLLDPARRAAFTNFANAQWSLAATLRLAHASDASVLALMRAMLANARVLEKAPGEACFRYWFPQVSGPPDVAGHLDAAAQSHMLDAMAEVIRSSAEQPVPLPPKERVQDQLAAVVNSTYEEFGEDAQMLAHADDPRVDRAKVCRVTIAVYERILALPPADAAAVLRSMTQ